MITTYNQITERDNYLEPPFMDQNEIKALKICLNLFNSPINALEWGSGKSTLFFSSQLQQGSSWLALEHDPSWFQEVKTKIELFPSTCASVIHIQPDKEFDGLTDGDYATFRNYVLAPVKLENTYDFILVDGRARVECMAVGWSLLKENGVMVLHDAQRDEYACGIPKDCLSIRIVNPNVCLEGPISTLFMVKRQNVARNLAEQLVDSLEHDVLFKMNNIDGFNYSDSSQKSVSTNIDAMTWDSLRFREQIKLYAGDVPEMNQYDGWTGLSITKGDNRHILHDITTPFPLSDNSVDAFQAEDVFEHIDYEKLPVVLNEIFRVLKPGGLFRFSVPDYGCDVLKERSIRDSSGKVVFDPEGGGTPENPGHVWFPRIDAVRELINKSLFTQNGHVNFLHYYNMDGSFVAEPIDYSKGHVDRTPDFDERVKSSYRPMSMVVDLFKLAAPALASLSVVEGSTSSAVLPDATGRNLSCLFINTYYDAFLNMTYSRQQDLSNKPYKEQLKQLIEHNFGDSDFYSEGLKTAGWCTGDLIVNCVPLQQAWARENNFHGEGLNVVVEQIRRARPDVVYIQDLNICTKEFLAFIRPYTSLIVGQIASPIPPVAHLAAMDIIFSSFPHFVDRFRQAGITSYYQALAFEPCVLMQVPQLAYEIRPVECSFVGGLSPLHGKGYELLEYLAREVPIDFWGYGVGTLPVDSAINSCHHGEVWGNDMFRILSLSKITVNRHIDVAESNANNMRLFEATGCGALLITDYKDNLNDLFEIGTEIVAYRSQEECAALIKYYLVHPGEAAVIAKAGQERTLREHTYRLRMGQTAEILERHLRYKREKGKLQIPGRISDGHQEITQAEVTQAMESAWKDPAIPLQQRALVQKQLEQMYHGEVAVPFQVLANILTPIIHGGETLLEIGCASGYYYEVLEYLLNQRVAYTGVDYSEPMIEMAKDYYPNATFFVADGANLFFADRQFHIVISSCVLLHVPNWRQNVFETVRVADKYVVVSRTPVCRQNPTRFMKKYAYGVETVELTFNEAEIVLEFLLHGLELVDAVQYDSNPEADTYQVTYLFRRT